MNCVRLVLCGIALGSFSFGALAQNQQSGQQPGQQSERQPGQRAPGEGRGPGMGFGGRQLSPEKAKAAWELQAKGVAGRLGLNEAQTKSLVSAYLTAREAQGTAAEKIRQEAMQAGQEGGMEAMRESMKKIEEVSTTQRENLKKALAGSLSSEQVEKAMASLGTFNRQWDRVVDVFGTFKLDAAQQQQGLNAIEDYAVTLAAAQAQAQAAMNQRRAEGGGPGEGGGAGGGGAGERNGIRTANQEGRQQLLTALQPLLNKEQVTKIEEALPGAGRGPGGAGGGRRGGGGGGGGS